LISITIVSQQHSNKTPNLDVDRHKKLRYSIRIQKKLIEWCRRLLRPL